MSRYSYGRALIAAALLILALYSQLLSGQESGVIDQAPPPSEEQKNQAAAWSKRVADIATLIEHLAPSIRASFSLREAVLSTKAIPPDAREKAANGQSRWEESRRKLFVQQQGTNRWSIDADAIKPYVLDTLNFESALETASRLLDELKASAEASNLPFVVQGYAIDRGTEVPRYVVLPENPYVAK